MIGLTDQQLDELYERSKHDRCMIVGSEVRQLIAMIRRLQNKAVTIAALDATPEQAEKLRAIWEAAQSGEIKVIPRDG